MGLSYNQITEIPPEIGQLKQINWLNFTYNQITTLPEELLQLQTLQELDLKGNPINYFDPQIKEVVHELEANGVNVVK